MTYQSCIDIVLLGIKISELKCNSSYPTKAHSLSAGEEAPAVGTLVYLGMHTGYWVLLA